MIVFDMTVSFFVRPLAYTKVFRPVSSSFRILDEKASFWTFKTVADYLEAMTFVSEIQTKCR